MPHVRLRILYDPVVIITLLAIILLRGSAFAHYRIPSVSMLPSLKVGDHVLVNKLAYGLSLPFTDRRVASWSTPRRGDVVVFPHPSTGVTYIKRVIGLPGDHVAFWNGSLTINNVPVPEHHALDLSVLADLDDTDRKGALIVEELSGIRHLILRADDFGNTRREERSWIVPDHHLFVLGDNRDDSFDSRAWGFVNISRVTGRAGRISFSTQKSDDWIPKFRAERFFMRLE